MLNWGKFWESIWTQKRGNLRQQTMTTSGYIHIVYNLQFGCWKTLLRIHRYFTITTQPRCCSLDLDAYRIIVDLFGAGTETTSTTLQWFIVYMMYNTQVAEKCKKEIHEVGYSISLFVICVWKSFLSHQAAAISLTIHVIRARKSSE